MIDTGRPLHTNFQVANVKRCECAFTVQSRKLVHVSGTHCHMQASSTRGCASVCFGVQSCIEHSSPVSLFQAQEVGKQGWKQEDAAGTTVLLKVPYCKMKMFSYFLCLLVMCYLGEKYHKPITAQYYIVTCLSWVPRLTLSDLTNKSDLRKHFWDGTRSYVGDLLYPDLKSGTL